MTKIIKIDKDQIDPALIKQCGEFIKNGKLVVFPTETVYGLGANAYDDEAIVKIFKAKGRPQDNPLIVHVSDEDMVDIIATDIPDIARKLMKKFWPGPLTIVLKKKEILSESITCGLTTVGVRMPSHPVANELIKKSGVPIAAPSANTSGNTSPTIAEHVIDDLNGKVECIIDSGNTEHGIESTIVDVTKQVPVLLRPGSITIEQLREVLGKIEIDDSKKDSKPICPGTKYRHYAPKTKFILATGEDEKDIKKKIEKRFRKLQKEDKKVVIIGSKELYGETDMQEYVLKVGSREDLSVLAANIFKALRSIDKMDFDYILIGSCPEEGIGRAIMNRLRKAASEVI